MGIPKTRALIVDDDEQHLNLMRILLESHGHEVITAGNGVEALEKARQDPPGVVVTDILMPMMDGFSLCRHWKEDKQLQGIPLVFYTGTFTDPEDEKFALSLGAEYFIVKPAEPELLVEIVHRLISEHPLKQAAVTGESISGDRVYYKEYNEALIRKLEDKLIQLKETKQDLELEIAERAQGTRALRESGARYRELADSITDVFFAMDKELKYTYWNKASEELTGISAQDAIGKSIYELFPDTPQTRKAVGVYQEVLRTRQHQSFMNEYQLGGVDYFFDISVYPSRDGISIFTKDITNRMHAEEALRLTQFSIDRTGDAAFWMGPDARFVYVNDVACRILGYTSDELLSMRVYDIDPDFPEEVWAEHWEEVKQRGTFTFESRHRSKDGRIFPVEITVNYLEFGGKEYNCAFVRDITERKQAEAALRESEARFRSIYTQSPIGIELYDLDGCLIAANDICLELFGVKELEEIKGFNLFEDPNLPEDAKQRLLAGEEVRYEAEFSFDLVKERDLYETTKSGRVHISVHVAPWQVDEPGKGGYLVHVRDISERKQAEATIRHLAYHDDLTGLPNRRLFADRLSVALANAQRHREKLVVMLLDLDQFKKVNDTLGHNMGDKLLQVVGIRLAGLLRQSDTVARMGGDEFLLIIPGIARGEDAATTAKKIMTAFGEPFVFDGQELIITTSIGIALYPDDGNDGGTLMKNADIAMYRAKDKGRNNYQRYSS